MRRQFALARAARGFRAARAVNRAACEALEQRRLLAGVVINEFLADNSTGIVDQDNDHSDWIELKNTDATAVNLGGWSLTDDAANLTKWQFPSTTLAGGGYLVVWASGKNRAVAGQQLHTNFSLDNDGEYLALVKPGGTIVADSFNPYPAQLTDISYGRGSSSSVTDTLIGEDALLKAKVPTAASSIDTVWRNASFVPDGTWQSGPSGVGYDTSPSPVDYTPYIGVNVQSAMSGTGRTSVYIRVPFDVADPTVLSSLHLKMQYDDGFIAYLNGSEVGVSGSARRNFSTTATPAWNSIANATHADDQAVLYEDIDISANLNLLTAGTNVLAIQGLNVASSSDLLISPQMTADRATTTSLVFMVNPTPGTQNSTGTLGFVGDTHFSFDRGFYDAPIDVAITTSTPGATIRYTLDGTVPTATSGTVYTAPIHITTTKTLRAAAFKTGWTPTDVDTQTYVYLNDVIHQTGAGLPPFASWGHAGADWDMDPNVVNNSTYSGTIVNDMKAVPTMSLVMPWSDWFGSGGVGIYPSGSGIEKATSVEMFSSSNPADEFHSLAAVEIQGASSTQRWNEDKLSFRLTFKPPFGPTKLDQDLFTDPTLDKGAANKFDRLILDAMYDDTWMDPSGTNRSKAKEVQDQYAGDLQNIAGSHGPHGRYVQLYLNGLYWGMYYLHEEPEDQFASQYFGGNKDDYDVVKHNASTVVAGGSQATTDFNSMLTAVRQNMTVAANYTAVAAKLDVVDFIDYMIVNYYIGNTDWASHNWYASFNRVDPAGRWRFHSWDAELSLQDVNTDVTTKNETGSPTEIQTRLMANAEYKLKFADEVQRLMFNGGVMSPTGAAAVYSQRINQIDRAIVGESARWGDNLQEPPLTRAGWRSTQDGLLATYFPARTGIVLNQFTARGWLASLGAPTYSQFGGTVSPGYQLTISKPSGSPAGAVIYYTLDGSDPRLIGGAINTASAVQYTGPITLNVSRRVKARIFNSGSWSAIVDAVFLMPTLFPVRISELHYHPANHTGVSDAETMEFIELVNIGTSTVNLQGVQLTKFASPGYTFSTSINLAAGQRIVVAQNHAIFQQVYGTGINLAPGEYGTGNLSNGGEEIALLGPLGETLEDFTYGDENVPGWPTAPDGHGPSLEINDPLDDPSVGANWHASFVNGGTPGTITPPPTTLLSNFVFDSINGVRVQFDHDMDQSTFATGDIDITLLPGGTVFHPSAVSFPDSKTALFTFATPLGDGNYHATLKSGSVSDLTGQAIGVANDLDFFALGADANHDRHVDAADQAILTANLGQAGTFSMGDFDRNGTVNSADQAILTAAMNLWLAPVGALPLAATSDDDAYRLRKESATLLDLYAGADAMPTYRVMTAGVTSISFAGGAGDDALVIDEGNGDPLGSIPMSFDGGNLGTDALGFAGSPTAADNVGITATTLTAGGALTYSGVENVHLDGKGGGAGDVVSVANRAVALDATQHLASLSIDGSGGVVTMPSGAGTAVLVVNTIATSNGGKLDLLDKSLIVKSMTSGAVESLIKSGFNISGTFWTGEGITTSLGGDGVANLHALGVIQNDFAAAGTGSGPIYTSFAGENVGVNDVLVKYTVFGDADLDGNVTSNDYFQIDTGFLAGKTAWINGDFDYDGAVTSNDYFLIDNAFLAQAMPAPPPAAPAQSPQDSPGLVPPKVATAQKKPDSLAAAIFGGADAK